MDEVDHTPQPIMDIKSKIRLYSVLLGLSVTFVIMASNKKGVLLPTSPYHFSSLVSLRPYTFNLSSVKDYAHIKLVVGSITSKVEFRSSRQLPELKALVNSEPHVSRLIICPHLFKEILRTQFLSKNVFSYCCN